MAAAVRRDREAGKRAERGEPADRDLDGTPVTDAQVAAEAGADALERERERDAAKASAAHSTDGPAGDAA